MLNKKSYKLNSLKVILALFLFVSIILPLMNMFFNIADVNITSIVQSPQFLQAAKNSILASSIATVLSVFFAGMLAWCITKTTVRYKSAFTVIFTLPMLIPSISHGMGFIILLGANGVITNLLNLNFSIYGLHGIVISSVMYSFPFAFLMILDILEYEDHSAYEAAKILGISKFEQFKSITIPYLRKPMISVLFATFTVVITDYGVPIMVGGKFTTLPVLMYQEVIGLLDFGKGSVIGIFLMAPALVAFIADIINKDKGNTTYQTTKIAIKANTKRDFFGYFIIIIACIFVLLPLITFALLTIFTKYPINITLTMQNIVRTFNMNGLTYLLNSIFIAIITSLVGTVLTYSSAYLSARIKDKMSRALHLIMITSLAVPGIVLGLAYAMFFNTSFIYGTIIILVFVNIAHFFASPYLIAYNSFSKLNENLEAVGYTLGISRFRLVKDIFIPQMSGSILEMVSYFFVNSMVTISAVSFLATVQNTPIALMITQFEAQMLIECSAFVSILILCTNIIMKTLVHSLKRKLVTHP